jgi:uncharacterized protein YkwD
LYFTGSVISPTMNWVDIFLCIIFLLALWAGWHRGFILGSIDLLSWTGSLILAYIFYPYMAKGLDRLFDIGPWLLPLAFILTALVARLLIGFIARYIIRRIPEKANYNPFNKFLGLIPGAINGWIAAIIISALLLSLPLKDSITNTTRNSRFAGKLAMQSEWANRKLAPVFDDAIKQTINSLTVKPSSGEKVLLPFKYDHPTARPQLEAEMLVLVNKERTSRGLKPLAADPEMTMVARAHSKDMFARGYFAHYTPEGTDPFQRMDAAGVQYRTAGENLALAQTVEMAHTNLMNSPGHKANILNPAYGRLGIGVLDGGYYGLMISQEFRN